jgi:hypothetical protein
MVKLTLPTDSAERKNVPVLSGCLSYAPAALAGMARWSKVSNDKHNPGEPLHHARGKSTDHGECIVRHLMDIQDLIAALDRMPRGSGCDVEKATLKQLKDDLDALVWRAAILSQEAHEKYFGAPLAPSARLPALTQSDARCGERANAALADTRSSGAVGWYTCSLPAGHVGKHSAHAYHDTTRPALVTWGDDVEARELAIAEGAMLPQHTTCGDGAISYPAEDDVGYPEPGPRPVPWSKK